MSGGLDSGILLGHLLRTGWTVQPFYVRTGCVWERSEMAAARRFLHAVAEPRLAALVEFDMAVGDLNENHWSQTGRDTPDHRTPDEAVFIPGRNPLLLLKPALWCASHGIGSLALGTLAANPFPDASDAFFSHFEAMIEDAVGHRLEITRPLAAMDKQEVMLLGAGRPLELTLSCLSPVQGRHCGMCNKCAERALAFRQAMLDDPTDYAAVHASQRARGTARAGQVLSHR